MSPYLAVLRVTFMRTFFKIRFCKFSFFAGGASVHWHMLQPNSYKYFARAISLSGVLNQEWAGIPSNQQVKKLAADLKKLACPHSNPTPDQVKDFLVALPTERINSLLPKTRSAGPQYKPVNTFGCEQPTKTFVAHNKPLILGICAEEGKIYPDFVFPRRDKSHPTKLESNATVQNA